MRNDNVLMSMLASNWCGIMKGGWVKPLRASEEVEILEAEFMSHNCS